jgi:hypothetical protein
VGVLCVTMGWWWKREGEMREEGMMGWRGPVVGELEIPLEIRAPHNTQFQAGRPDRGIA